MSLTKDHECTVRIPNFSDENVHAPGSVIEEDCGNIHWTRVYANGMSDAEQGHVTITVTPHLNSNSEVSCVVSVVDASGNRRFPTSEAFSTREVYNAIRVHQPITMARVLKRETLLDEAHELLPEDCLTLHFHIEVHERPPLSRTFWDGVQDPRRSFQVPPDAEGDVRLPLDSALARRLIEVSPYFRGLSEHPMVERQRGYATFPRGELDNLLVVCEILLGKEFIVVRSVDQLLEIYDIADKYIVPPAVESCKGMMSTLLKTIMVIEENHGIEEGVMGNTQKFLLQMRYGNQLKEIVEDNDEDTRTVESAAEDVETEWRLENAWEVLGSFVFTRGAREDHLKFYQ